MAVKSRKTQLGNYITKVNDYDIRQKYSYRKNAKGKQEIGGSQYVVCRGRKLIKDGFKSKEAAMDYANNN